MLRVLLLLCLLSTNVFAATIKTSLSHTEATLNDTVELRFTLEGNTSPTTIDLRPLEKDFTIVGTGQKSDLLIANGKANRATAFSIILLPKHLGTLKIPTLQLGNQKTRPQTLTVKSTVRSIQAINANDIFMTTTVDKKEPYVQAELIYTVRLYYSINIPTGTLSNPYAKDTIVLPLGDDKHYTEKKEGRQYLVLERHFALFPQNSGPLSIESPLFTGLMEKQTADGFSLGPRNIRIGNPSIEINVKEIPTQQQSNWLPAKSLHVEEQWRHITTPTVGEPITRTITITALGTTAAQIPSLPKENIPNFKLYQDVPERNNHIEGDHLVGMLIQKITYIPTESGDLSLPKITIPWWNTQENVAKTTMLNTRNISVTGEARPKAPSVQTRTLTPQKKITLPSAQLKKYPWLTISLVLLLLGCITTGLWLYRDRRHSVAFKRKKDMKPSQKHITKAIQIACTQEDAKKLQKALLQWAAIQWPVDTPKTLDALSQKVIPSELSQHIIYLNQQLYAKQKKTWSGQHFLRAFQQYQQQHKKQTKHTIDHLPPLYES